MREYLLTLMSVALLSGIIGMISPEGDTKKYVRLIGALCLLCAIARPIAASIYDGSFGIDGLLQNEAENETENYEEIYEKMLSEGGKSYAEEVIKGYIAKDMSLEESTFDIEISDDSSGVASVTVYLRDGAIFADPRKISEYVNDKFDCACVVVYD